LQSSRQIGHFEISVTRHLRSDFNEVGAAAAMVKSTGLVTKANQLYEQRTVEGHETRRLLKS